MAKSSNEKLIIYTDGGSRGNPGEAALGVVFKDAKEILIKSYGERIGVRTNNEAEYEAVISALKKAKAMFGKDKIKKIDLEVKMDSELAVKQLSGKYKIESDKIVPLFVKIWNLKLDFGKIVFRHIPREQNKDADRMVNEALDSGQITLL